MFFLSLPSRGLKGPPDDCHDPEASQGSIFSGLTNHQRGWLGCLNFCRIKLLQRHTGWPAIVAYASLSAKSSGIAELRYAGAGPPLDLPCAKPWHPLSAPSSATPWPPPLLRSKLRAAAVLEDGSRKGGGSREVAWIGEQGAAASAPWAPPPPRTSPATRGARAAPRRRGWKRSSASPRC